MPRQKKVDPGIQLTTYIPESLYVELEMLLPRDPLTGKAKYGSKSDLVAMLIRRWVKEQRQVRDLDPRE